MGRALTGIAGAVIGDSFGYLLGNRYGERLLGALLERLLKPEHVQRTGETIEHLGGRAVSWAGSTATLHALAPGIAECPA